MFDKACSTRLGPRSAAGAAGAASCRGLIVSKVGPQSIFWPWAAVATFALAAFALGLVLFVVTLCLNVFALHIVRKYREKYD